MIMDSSQPKSQDIPFLIDGMVKIVKSVTKHTTCNDVINKLPNLQCPLAVFESVDGIERELSGKTKLLKVWRTHGASSKVVFVVKKSEETGQKSRRRSTLFNVTRKVLRPQSKRRNSKENLKKVTDLAFYVRYQKSKVQSMKRKLDDIECEESGKRGLKQFRSSSSMDSMDRFLVNTDLEKMDTLLSFCGYVTEEQLGLRRVPKASRDQDIYMSEPEIVLDVKETKPSIVRTSLKNMRLGFKQKFASNKTDKRTTSAGTLSSADTGYQSVASSKQGNNAVNKPTGLPKRHTFILPDLDDAPRHSTPVNYRSNSVSQQQDHDTSMALSDFDENEGKDALLQKFMADQEVSARRATMTCDDFLSVSQQASQRSRSERYSMPAFNSQKDHCRYLWDMYCDSDSDSSSVSDVSNLWDASQLDNAFIDSVADISDAIITPKNRTLRRESAISNLAKFSLVTKPINIDDDEDSFDYSFNCTFPRMDESQSVNFTSCFGNEAISCDVNFDGDATKEFADATCDFDVTKELLKDICDSEDSYEESDEGLGSMSSGSVQDVMYI